MKAKRSWIAILAALISEPGLVPRGPDSAHLWAQQNILTWRHCEPVPGTEERLKAWGIRELFSLVFTSAELDLSKPDRRIFYLSVAQAGCKAGEAVLVGDRPDNDVGPAMQEGWKTIRVLQGFSRFQVPRQTTRSPS